MSYQKPSVDLGLAILSATTPPGVRRSHREIAAYCDCHWNNIFQIERRALKKLRNRLFFIKDPQLRDAVDQLLGRSTL